MEKVQKFSTSKDIIEEKVSEYVFSREALIQVIVGPHLKVKTTSNLKIKTDNNRSKFGIFLIKGSEL